MQLEVSVTEPVSEGSENFSSREWPCFSPPETSYLADSRGNNKSEGMQRISTGCSPPFCHLFSASTDVIPLALTLPLAICQHSDVLLIRGFTGVT